MRDDILIAYIPCPTIEEARRIGHILVEERLAACVNIRAHEAIYRWHGLIETGTEHALIAKTTRAIFPRLRERALALHSYSLPCIVAIAVAEGHAPFLDWVAAETLATPA